MEPEGEAARSAIPEGRRQLETSDSAVVRGESVQDKLHTEDLDATPSGSSGEKRRASSHVDVDKNNKRRKVEDGGVLPIIKQEEAATQSGRYESADETPQAGHTMRTDEARINPHVQQESIGASAATDVLPFRNDQDRARRHITGTTDGKKGRVGQRPQTTPFNTASGAPTASSSSRDRRNSSSRNNADQTRADAPHLANSHDKLSDNRLQVIREGLRHWCFANAERSRRDPLQSRPCFSGYRDRIKELDKIWYRELLPTYRGTSRYESLSSKGKLGFANDQIQATMSYLDQLKDSERDMFLDWVR